MNTTFLDCIQIETAPNPTHAVIWLHGLGADGNDFAPLVPELHLLARLAIRFIFPHAPIQPVTINNGMAMRAWYDILNVDLVRREDEQGVRDSQKAIEALVARENQRGIANDKIVLAGFSQGCAVALHTGLRASRPLAGIMGLSGYLPLAEKFGAERHSASQDTPIFLAHGKHDPVVAIERAEASYQPLRDMGYSITWKTYNMQHSVCPEEISDIAAFLGKVLV